MEDWLDYHSCQGGCCSCRATALNGKCMQSRYLERRPQHGQRCTRCPVLESDDVCMQPTMPTDIQDWVPHQEPQTPQTCPQSPWSGAGSHWHSAWTQQAPQSAPVDIFSQEPPPWPGGAVRLLSMSATLVKPPRNQPATMTASNAIACGDTQEWCDSHPTPPPHLPSHAFCKTQKEAQSPPFAA